MNKFDFTVFGRQSAGSLFFIFLKQSKTTWKITFPLFIYFIVSGNFKLLLFLILATTAIEILVFVSAFLTYRNFKFRLTDGTLIIQRGTFNKKNTVIPLQTVQNVQSSEGFWYQVFELRKIMIDTAGTKKSECELVLDLEVSEKLQKLILATIEKSSATISPGLPETEIAEPEVAAEKKINYQYSIKNLFIAGMTANHLRGLGLIFVALSALWNQLDFVIEPIVRRMDIDLSEEASRLGLKTILIILALAYLISLVISLIYIAIKRYGLKLSVSQNNISFTSGLFEVLQKNIKREKLTYLHWTKNPFEYLAHTTTVYFAQHQSVENANRKEMLKGIPGFWAIDEIRDTLYPDWKTQYWQEFRPVRYYLTRNLLLKTLYPALLLAVATWFWFPARFILIFWVLLTVSASFLRQRKTSAKIGDDYICISNGSFTDSYYVTEINSLESVSFSQSVFQKRRGVASLKLYTRNDMLTIPFIAEDLAKKLYNYLIYRNEADIKLLTLPL